MKATLYTERKMMKNKTPRILLAEDSGLEPSFKKRSKAVRDHVVAIARRLDLSIDLAHVDDLAAYPLKPSHFNTFIDRFMSDRRKRLESYATTKAATIQPIFLSGPVVTTLLGHTKKGNKYEMIAVGTRGRRGISRILLGSVAEEIVRNSEIPVFVVGAEAQKHASQINATTELNILVATDLGPHSRKAEAYALKLAKSMGAKVILAHSLFENFHPILKTAFTSAKGRRELADVFAKIKRESLTQLERRKKHFKLQNVVCDSIVDERTTDAGDAILKLVKSIRPAFVLMGTHGRTLVTQAFLGSTARQVILESPAPVMIIPSIIEKKRLRGNSSVFRVSEKEIYDELQAQGELSS